MTGPREGASSCVKTKRLSVQPIISIPCILRLLVVLPQFSSMGVERDGNVRNSKEGREGRERRHLVRMDENGL